MPYDRAVQLTINDPIRQASVQYETAWLSPSEQSLVLAELEANPAAFEESGMRAPRLVAAFTDDSSEGHGLANEQPWPAAIDRVRRRLEEQTGHAFNYAIVNWYRDGRDYVGWHADKIHLHTPGTSIAILSLGAPRPLRFRGITDGQPLAEFTLASGSLLRMAGDLQLHYEHSVPLDESVAAARFSITFRNVLPHEEGS